MRRRARADRGQAARIVRAGPERNRDRLRGLGTVRMGNRLTGTSQDDAGVRGVEAAADSFGLNGQEELTATSGRVDSVAGEAPQAGGCQGPDPVGHHRGARHGRRRGPLALPRRPAHRAAGDRIGRLGPSMVGGEVALRREGVQGRHGTGRFTDGRNPIENAPAEGGPLVGPREELLSHSPKRPTVC
jgi:hypothetical protein